MSELKKVEIYFEKYRHKLWNDLVTVNAYFKLSNLILNLSKNEKKIFDLSPRSLSIIHSSLNFSLIVILYKFFSKSSNDISLFKYLKFIKKNFQVLYSIESYKNRNSMKFINDEKLFNLEMLRIEEIDIIENEINEKKNTLDNLRKIRNKLFAHNDFAIYFQKKSLSATFNYDESEILIELIQRILNKLSVAYDGMGLGNLPLYWDDINNLFQPEKLKR